MGQTGRVSGARRVRRRWFFVITGVAAITLLVISGMLVHSWIVALPYEVAEASAPLDLTSAAGTAAVDVPEGWVVRRDGDAAAVVSTPDQAMTARVALVAWAADETLQSRFATDASVQRELLDSGFVVDHADRPASADTVAVVRRPDAAADEPAVVVTAEIAAGHDPAVYRPALGALLEAITP